MRRILSSLLLAFTAVMLSAAEFTDAEWAAMRREMLSKPRRVFLDNDGNDAINFPKDMEVTLENFYAQMMTPMIGCQFDVLLYCPGTTDFAVISKTATGHRMLKTPNATCKNATEELEAKFGADPATLAQRFAREHGFEFVMGMRGNDDHGSYYPDFLSDYKKAHPELLVGSPSDRPRVGGWSAFDMARPEARELFKKMVFEWFDTYDLDGFSIDFQRGTVYFKSVAQGGMASREEMDALTQMLREVRAYAEQVARRRGRPMYYVFRAPDSELICNLMGLDIRRWMEEGLFDYYAAGGDMGHFNPYSQSVALAHQYGVKCLISEDFSWLREPDGPFTRNAAARYDGEFLNAAAAGADGMYLFNMVYQKYYYPLVRRNPADLVGANKSYFVTAYSPWGAPQNASQPKPGEQGILPSLYPQYALSLGEGRSQDFVLEVGDDLQKLPDEIGLPAVRLYLKTKMDAARPIIARINGVEAVFLEQENGTACYAVPPSALKPGANTLTLAAPARIAARDLVILTGSELLGGANQPPWRRLFPGNGMSKSSEQIVEGAYRLTSTAKGPVNLIYPLGAMDGQAVTVKAQVRVVAGAAPGSAVLRVANGKYLEVVDFMDGRVRLRHARQEAAADTAAFHDYALTIAEDGAVTLLMDGAPFLSGSLPENARDARNQLKGTGFKMPGMNDASILIGGLDAGAAGAADWRNLRYANASVTVSDAVLRLVFPPHATASLHNILARKEFVYRQECADGIFKEVDGVKREYPPLKKAEGRAGVVLDHTGKEWNMVNMSQFPPFQEPRRFMTAEWKVTCTKPPRKAGEQNFQVVMRPLLADGAKWELVVRSEEGFVITPAGKVKAPAGAQSLAAAVDSATGEYAVWLDGQVIASGHLGKVTYPAGVLYGDTSSTISGEAVLEYIRIGYFDE